VATRRRMHLAPSPVFTTVGGAMRSASAQHGDQVPVQAAKEGKNRGPYATEAGGGGERDETRQQGVLDEIDARGVPCEPQHVLLHGRVREWSR
jgi:hypothetical protein